MGALTNGTTCRTGTVRLMEAWKGACLHLGTFCLGLLLAGCGGGGGDGGSEAPSPRTADKVTISGTATTEDGPLNGAVVSISKLDITQTSETTSRRGKIVSVDIGNFQPTVGADGVFSFQLESNLLQDETLYSLSVTCPKPVTDICLLQAPLHAVLSGKRLKQAVFSVNVLTEVVYQRLGYYIAAGFKATELQQEIDSLSRMLLNSDIDGENSVTHEDVLQWGPTNSARLKLRRPNAVSDTTAHLSEDSYKDQLQLVIQTLFSPIVTSILTPNPATQIVVEGDFAYVLNGPQLTAIDISDPFSPLTMQSLEVPYVVEMTLASPYIYASYRTDDAEGESGLQVIDISDPGKMHQRGKVILEGISSGVSVVESTAYVPYAPSDSTKPSGLVAIDFSNPDLPSIKKQIILEKSAQQIIPCGIAIFQDFAYVTSPDSKLYAVNISSDQNPQPQYQVDAYGKPCDIAIHNNNAYVATEYSGVHIFDLSDPAHPEATGNIRTRSISRRLAIAENNIYIASATTGLQTFDVSNPAAPILRSIFDTPLSAHDVAVKGAFAFVADNVAGVHVIDLSEQPPPSLVGMNDAGGVAITTEGNFAYILAQWPLLNAVNIEDSSNPIALFQQGNHPSPEAIALNKERLLVAVGEGIQIYKLDGVGEPKFVKSLATTGWADGIAIRDNTAFIAVSLSGLQVVDISDLETPKLGDRLDTSDDAYNVVLKDQFAYVADGGGGLKVINISDVDNLELIGSVDTPGIACNIVLDGNIAYVTDTTEGLQIIDISVAERPKIISSIDTPGIARDLVVANNIAYIADDHAGVQAIDVRDPDRPVFIGAARTNAGALGIAAKENNLFITTRYGLEILRTIPTN